MTGTVDDIADGIASLSAGTSAEGCNAKHHAPGSSSETGSDATSGLERFVREMEEKQDEVIDAILDLSSDSGECAVALGEET